MKINQQQKNTQALGLLLDLPAVGAANYYWIYLLLVLLHKEMSFFLS